MWVELGRVGGGSAIKAYDLIHFCIKYVCAASVSVDELTLIASFGDPVPVIVVSVSAIGLPKVRSMRVLND
jgi:hypothetical protein